MNPNEQVEELTGLYGPVFMAEKQVQRIWARQVFRQQGLVTRSGQRLEVLDPGRWNFQEGPDFREAILTLNGRRIHGDVEIHLHERDWQKHGHGSDKNFKNVILHVVLFPDRREGRLTQGSDPSTFETLEWLKYLDRDLETYFDDQGVDQLLDEGLPAPLASLLELPAEAREQALINAARERWERKVKVAQSRINLSGVREAYHQVFLEVLGLKRNRAIMSQLAHTFPLSSWLESPTQTAMTAYQQFNDKWHLSGCRPANQPKRRLKQYAEWLSNGRTDWPDAIHRGSSALPRGGDSERLSASRVRKRRQEYGFTKHEEDWRTFFTPGVGGTRFHTWMTDGLIPLDQATQAAQSDHFSTWFLWPVGDVPDRIKSTLQTLEVTGPGRPLCNGWTQGIIRMLEPDYIPEEGNSVRG